jgi:hypothetical protein
MSGLIAPAMSTAVEIDIVDDILVARATTAAVPHATRSNHGGTFSRPLPGVRPRKDERSTRRAMDTLRLVVDLNRCQSYGQVRLRRAAGLPFPGEESLEYDYAPGSDVERAAAAARCRRSPSALRPVPRRRTRRTRARSDERRTHRCGRRFAGRPAARGGGARAGIHRRAHPDRRQAPLSLRPGPVVQGGAVGPAERRAQATPPSAPAQRRCGGRGCPTAPRRTSTFP